MSGAESGRRTVDECGARETVDADISRSMTIACGMAISPGTCLFEFFDPHVAERDRAVIALQKDRARLVDLVVDFAAGRFVALDVVVDLHAVEHDGDLVALDRGFGGLPLVAGLGDEFIRLFEVVDRAVSAEGRLAAGMIAENLDFVPAAKIEAAVGVCRGP